MTVANQEQMRSFVKIVDDFYGVRSTLQKKQAAVYASGDANLIADYNSFMSKSNALNMTIENTVGAWNAAKNAWSKVTDISSTYIGDAVDWFREVFSDYNADGMSAFGAIQLPAAAWVAGISASAFLLWRTGKTLVTRIDAVSIAAAENIPYDQALIKADHVNRFKIFSPEMAPLIIGALAAGYFLWWRKK